jgi:hypothetical protein
MGRSGGLEDNINMDVREIALDEWDWLSIVPVMLAAVELPVFATGVLMIRFAT